MRTIEFRAWNSIDKSYVDWHTLKGMPRLLSSIIQGREKHYLIEQFTGLYVTGGSLYQGDLILDHVGIGEVVWCDKNCAFKVSYRGCNKGVGKWFADYLDKEFTSIEIIGNIHEEVK